MPEDESLLSENEQMKKDSTDVECSFTNAEALIRAGRLQLERHRQRVEFSTQELKNSLQLLSNTVERERQLTAIKSSVEALIDRMDSELEYQRLNTDSGKLTLPPLTDCAAILRRLLKLFSKMYVQESLVFEVLSDDPVTIRIDEHDLRIVLSQLIDNACKWSANRIRVDMSVRESWLEVMVEDDGPGFTVEQIPHLLSRGGRADSKSSGHGLGLYVVHQLVKDTYGGDLQIEKSTLGGVRIRVSLDCAFHDQLSNGPMHNPTPGPI